MRKIVRYGSIIYSFLIFISSISLLVYAKNNIEEIETKVLDEEVLQVIEDETILIVTKETETEITKLEKKKIIQGSMIAHLDVGNYHFFIMKEEKNMLYQVAKDKLEIKTVEISMEYPKQIVLFHSSLVIGGNHEGNASLQVFNFQLQVIQELHLKGSGFQSLDFLLVMGNDLYGAGEKDACAEHPHFENVGNRGERKSFLFKWDSSFQITAKCYFNELYEEEKIVSLGKYKNGIGIVLRAEKLYQFVLDQDLNITERFNLPWQEALELYPSKQSGNGHLYMVQTIHFIYIIHLEGEKKEILTEISGKGLNAYFLEGKLNLYYTKEEKTYLKIIEEYHVNSYGPLICNYFQYDETRMSHLQMDSYFEDLTVELKSITPYFSRNLPGTYEATYQAIKRSGKVIEYKAPLIVKSYVNIMQQGIYIKGSRLIYFGIAILDGEPILSGTVLKETGKHILEITNANGEKTTYEFVVVEDYYKQENAVYMDTDFTLEYGGQLWIPLTNYGKVKKVILNQKEIENIELINGQSYLKISSCLEPGIQEYHLESIEMESSLENPRRIVLDYYFTIRTKKRPPILEVQEYKENGKLKMNIEITDIHQTIMKLEANIYQNEKRIQTIPSYLQNQKGKIDQVSLHQPFQFILNMITEDGIKVQAERQLFFYQGILNNKSFPTYQLEYQFEENVLSNIYFEMNMDNPKTVHQKITLGEEEINLVHKYQVEKDNTIWYVIGSISFLSLVLFFFIIWKIQHLKKVKIKEKNVNLN